MTAFNAVFTDLAFRQNDGNPYVTGLDGTVSGALDAGIFSLHSTDSTFSYDRLFRETLQIDAAHGELRWRNTAGQLEITVSISVEFAIET